MCQDNDPRMKIVYVFVISVFTGFVLSSDTELSSSNKCNYFKNCVCLKLTDYEIKCPAVEHDVVMNLVEDKYIEISCETQNSYKLDVIPNVNMNVESLKVQYCDLPINQFKIVIQKFNITNLKKLYLEECVIGGNTLQHINRTFLEDLSSLESISIRYSSIILENNVFEHLPNLTHIFLDQNNLTEIAYLFEQNSKLQVLDLSQNLLKTLPDNIFNKLSELHELQLSKNKLTNITQSYFVGLKNLKSLELSINSISFIDETAFSELFELIDLNLSSNKIELLKVNTFRNNPKIENIRIGGNPNLVLSDYVFANLTSLQNLSIDHCNLRTLPEHIFENALNMKLLDLQNNSIENLPQNVFSSLKNLQKLILNNNKIASFPDKIFSSLKKLEMLDLDENQLVILNENIFEGLRNLKTLILKNNMIMNIDITTFSYQKKLTFLDLSYNKWIGENYIFSYLEKLEYLLLSHNKISEFPEEIINSAVYLKELDLSFNQLNSIDVTSLVKVSNYYVKINVTHNSISYINFDNAVAVANENVQDVIEGDAFHNSNGSATQIDISHNPLVCDCTNFELVQYLKDKINPVVKRFIDIIIHNDTCYGPQDYKHIKIKDLRPEQITCEYKSKKCPPPCTCYLRPYDNAVIVDCSFKNLTKLPTLQQMFNITLRLNKLEINLERNSIEVGPKEGQGYEMVHNLFLSYNKLKSFDWCPPKIQVLKLDHNNIQGVNSNVLKTLNSSTNFSRLTLDNNPWSCGCSALDLQNFLKTHFNKVKIKNVVCEEDKIPITDKKEMCKSKITLIMQIVIPILSMFVLSATLLALYFRYKQEIKIWLFSKNCCLWFVTEEESDKNKKYDIFVSFSHKDEDFVAQNLVPSLEKSYKLCIHTRDFIPGELINNQIADSVFNSRRTLVVLSNNFLESAWGNFEFLLAHKQSIEEGRPRVIVIKLGELNSDKMSDEFKAYIKTNTYVEWGEPWFWKKLFYALPHYNKNAPKTNQKHANMMLKIDDKFELVSAHPESTSPVGSVDSKLLQKQKPPLNFISSDINNVQPEVPLIKN